MEHSKIWMPILIGIVVGILAVRNHKKSDRTKQQWQQSQATKEAELPAEVDAPGEFL